MQFGEQGELVGLGQLERHERRHERLGNRLGRLVLVVVFFVGTQPVHVLGVN